MLLINKSAVGHLIIIKQPERFPKSHGHPKPMNKLILNEPARSHLRVISLSCSLSLSFSVHVPVTVLSVIRLHSSGEQQAPVSSQIPLI